MDYPELRRELTETVEELYRAKLISPTGGNISVRLPENRGFLFTPSMIFKGALQPEDMVSLDAAGEPLANQGHPSIETAMHLKVYQLKLLAGAVIHTHAFYATVLGLYDMAIPPFTLEAIRFGVLPIVPFCLPGSQDLVDHVGAALENNPGAQALLLRNHGLLVLGRDLRAAVNSSLALEEACRAAILCRCLGEEPALIPAEERELLRQFLVL
jgi:ribulose-5-phosphate 4-epimerase/fuculose-1-phosphate aldolase